MAASGAQRRWRESGRHQRAKRSAPLSGGSSGARETPKGVAISGVRRKCCAGIVQRNGGVNESGVAWRNGHRRNDHQANGEMANHRA